MPYRSRTDCGSIRRSKAIAAFRLASNRRALSRCSAWAVVSVWFGPNPAPRERSRLARSSIRVPDNSRLGVNSPIEYSGLLGLASIRIGCQTGPSHPAPWPWVSSTKRGALSGEWGIRLMAGGRAFPAPQPILASTEDIPGKSSRSGWPWFSIGWPVNKRCGAVVWFTSVWVIDRIKQTLSSRRAMPGRCSHTRTPGRAVWMVENSPRYSTGASGFGSRVSCWAGPPHKKIKMQAFAFPVGARLNSRPCSSEGRLIPNRGRAPVCTICLRVGRLGPMFPSRMNCSGF